MSRIPYSSRRSFRACGLSSQAVRPAAVRFDARQTVLGNQLDMDSVVKAPKMAPPIAKWMFDVTMISLSVMLCIWIASVVSDFPPNPTILLSETIRI